MRSVALAMRDFVTSNAGQTGAVNSPCRLYLTVVKSVLIQPLMTRRQVLISDRN